MSMFSENILTKQIAIQAAFVFVAMASNASAQTHVIKGELDATYYNWAGGLVNTQATSFTISIEGSRWLIKTEYAQNWFSLTGGDGTNSYHVLIDPNATNLPAPASIFIGDFPRDQFDRISIPWLAFCSSHFLSYSDQKDTTPSLWSQAQTDPMSHVCSTEVVQFSEPPYLPKEIKWITNSKQIASAFSNSFLRVEGATVKELDRRTIDFKANVQTGVTLGTYHVMGTTNVDGLILPLKFALDAYGYFSPDQIDFAQRALDTASKTNNLLRDRKVKNTYLVAVYTGIVNLVSSDNNHVTLPEPHLAMSITDYRLSSRPNGIDFVSYKSKEWKSKIDAELLDLLEAKKKNHHNNSIPSMPIGPGAETVVRIVILIIFFVPLIIWGARKLTKLKT